MATRPCKPDADVKRIWQRLLPDVPMPSCGTDENQENAGADARERTAPQDEQPPRQD